MEYTYSNQCNTNKNNNCSRLSNISYPSRTVVHAKLEMTEPGDHDEQEADAVANTIAAGGKISRKISGGSGYSGVTVSNQMESQLNHLQGGGQAMPTGLRSMMESGFGQDFSHVRLHTDSAAASLSSSIHAKAFTHGNDIYFNQGQFSPNTTEGQKLMAHELTHVVQGNKKIGRQDEAYESCMSVARTENCNNTGYDVCAPLTDMDKDNTNKCTIENFRLRAKVELLNLKSAYTDAVISIMNDKNKPKLPTDIFFHIAEDTLGAIPVVGEYIGKIPKYIDDMRKLVEYKEDINHFNAFEDVKDMYTDLFEEIQKKIYSSQNENELQEIAILLNQESCKGNLKSHYKQLMENKIKNYIEYVQPLGKEWINEYSQSYIRIATDNDKLFMVRELYMTYGGIHYYFLKDLPNDSFIINETYKKQKKPILLYRKENYKNKKFKNKDLTFNTLKSILMVGNSDYSDTSSLILKPSNELLTEEQVTELSKIIRNKAIYERKENCRIISYPNRYSPGKMACSHHDEFAGWEPELKENFSDWCEKHNLSKKQRSYLEDVLYELDAINWVCKTMGLLC